MSPNSHTTTCYLPSLWIPSPADDSTPETEGLGRLVRVNQDTGYSEARLRLGRRDVPDPEPMAVVALQGGQG